MIILGDGECSGAIAPASRASRYLESLLGPVRGSHRPRSRQAGGCGGRAAVREAGPIRHGL